MFLLPTFGPLKDRRDRLIYGLPLTITAHETENHFIPPLKLEKTCTIKILGHSNLNRRRRQKSTARTEPSVSLILYIVYGLDNQKGNFLNKNAPY